MTQQMEIISEAPLHFAYLLEGRLHGLHVCAALDGVLYLGLEFEVLGVQAVFESFSGVAPVCRSRQL